MVAASLQTAPEVLAAFCRKHSMRSLSVFGSVARGEAGPTSDVDLLVEFEPGKTPSLLVFAGMELEATQMIGRRAHLHTPAMLPPHARARILREAVVQHAG